MTYKIYLHWLYISSYLQDTYEIIIVIIIIVIILKTQTTNRIPSTSDIFSQDPLSYYILGQSKLRQVVTFHVKVHVNHS